MRERTGNVRRPATVLALLAGVFGLTLLRGRPPSPRPADAPPSEFSAGRARQVLSALLGDGAPHPVGSEANARVRERLAAELSRLGYAVEVQDGFACGGFGTCASVKNVLARRPGSPDDGTVLLISHYDSVPAGPGACDDGAGVAVALEVARILAAEPPTRNPVAFLFTDGEEAGLLGAEVFAAKHPLARRLGAVVNVEARGTTGHSLMFETGRGNAWIVRLFARAARRPVTSSIFDTIYRHLPNDTDFTVFKRRGAAGLNFAFVGGVASYHTSHDDLGHADAASLQHQGDNALASVRTIAEADPAAPHADDAVFFDVLAFGVVRWPEPGRWSPAFEGQSWTSMGRRLRMVR